MALPVVVSNRSAVSWSKVPGGIPSILNHSVFTGNVFFTHPSGTDTAGFGSHPNEPFKTIDFANNQCTANQGDVIFAMPGHTETIAAAGGIVLDTAGVQVVGLGQGADKALITFSATDSTLAMSAASVAMKNIAVTSSVNECVSMFNVTAADVTLDAIDYVDPGAALETIQFLLTTAAADRLTIKNCVHRQANAAASAQLWIALVGCTEPRILDNAFILDLEDSATSSVINGDTSVRLAELGRNRMHVTGYSSGLVSPVLMVSGATGIHYDSRIYCDTTIVTTINDAPSMASFEVYVSNDLDKNGILDPIEGS